MAKFFYLSLALICLFGYNNCGSSNFVASTPDTELELTRNNQDDLHPQNPSKFSFATRVLVTQCPDPSWCAENKESWPSSENGKVYRYTISEDRGALGISQRTAWIYIPNRITSPSPVLFALHGGNGSGLNMFAISEYAKMSDGRSISWKKNTDRCKYEPASLFAGNFKNSSGSNCLPAAVPDQTFTNNQGFVLVFPEGLEDKDSRSNKTRHWEDGRTESPGQGGFAETRDDLGFINFLVKQIKALEVTVIDLTRLYMVGVSNGGMMTLRLACNSENSSYPELQTVASFAAVGASMPHNLQTGSYDRSACPTIRKRPGAIALFVANDNGDFFMQPECPSYAKPSETPKCSRTVNGDGFMPYGIAGGGPYYLNSPDLGQVISVPDTINHFKNLLASSAGNSVSNRKTLGYFTTVTSYTFEKSKSRLVVYDTIGGQHVSGTSRMDFKTEAHVWDFLSSFQLSKAGILTYTSPNKISGTY